MKTWSGLFSTIYNSDFPLYSFLRNWNLITILKYINQLIKFKKTEIRIRVDVFTCFKDDLTNIVNLNAK